MNNITKLWGNLSKGNKFYNTHIKGGIKIERESAKVKLDEKINKMMASLKKDVEPEQFNKFEDKIRMWMNVNITTEEKTEEMLNDKSQLMEQFGLYIVDDLVDYTVEQMANDPAIMELKDEVLEELEKGGSIDNLIDKLIAVADNMDGDEDIPTSVKKKALHKLFKTIFEEDKKNIKNKQEKKNEIIAVEQKEEKSESNKSSNKIIDVEDAKDVDEENISFDSSNLIEIELEVDTVEGLICKVVNTNDEIVITDRSEIMAIGDKNFIKHSYYKTLIDARTYYKNEIDKITSNVNFTKLMESLHDDKVRVDIMPTIENDIPTIRLYKKGMMNPLDIKIDLDGKFITRHKKAIIYDNGSKTYYYLPLFEKDLLFNLVNSKYSPEELNRMNILKPEILALAEHIHLMEIPVNAFNKVTQKLITNKSISKEIFQDGAFYTFEGKINPSNFILYTMTSNGKKVITVKNNKVTTNF